jgi:hypothetical protein
MKHEVTYYPASAGYRKTCRYRDTGPRVLNHLVAAQRSMRNPLTRVRRIRTHVGTVTVLTFDDLIIHVRPITN